MDDTNTQTKRFFTPEEDAILRQYYPTYTAKQIQQQFLPYRSTNSIQSRGNHLNIAKESIAYEHEEQGHHWIKRSFTPEEDAIIREYYPTHTAKQIQQQFLPYRSTAPISARAKTLGIIKSDNVTQEVTQKAPQKRQQTKRFFTPEEDAIIREYYPTHTAKQIQQQFLPYRNKGCITVRAGHLNIAKDYTSLVEDVLEQEPIIEIPNYKKCSQCEKIKSKKCFRKDRTRPDGLHPYCKLCLRTRGLGIKRDPSKKGEEKEDIAEGYKRCTICKNIKELEQFHQNKKARDGRWPRCKVCDNARKKKKTHEDHMRTAYNLAPDDYQKMLEEQDGVCACCGQPETATCNGKVRLLAVDHCHTTEAIRGLLCQSCNVSLGNLREDPKRVKALLKYIEERCLW